MTALPLRLGRLEAAGHRVVRSGLRWLCADGYACRANEIVAYCNIALADGARAFGEESHDLQVAFAPRVGGRIRHAPSISRGGYLDRLPMTAWREDTIWATVEDPSPDQGANADEPELLFLAGRRSIAVAENRTGLLTGWHDRARAWWGEGAHKTIAAVGTCEMDAIFRGSDGFFRELFDAAVGPVQIALTQNEPLVSNGTILAEQLERTPAQMTALREEMAEGLLSTLDNPLAEDWLFAGALLGALEHCPITEDYEMLTRSGLTRTGPCAAVCLSSNAEMPGLLRHRKHGYALNLHGFRLARLGPTTRAWLHAHFEMIPRSVDDVAADYRRLIAALPNRAFFIINRFSSLQGELIQSYQGFDGSVVSGLSALRANELNLILCDLARELPNLAIVDADAIAADLGLLPHVPDGIHGSGQFCGEVRDELLRLIQALVIPGLAPRTVSQS